MCCVVFGRIAHEGMKIDCYFESLFYNTMYVRRLPRLEKFSTLSLASMQSLKVQNNNFEVSGLKSKASNEESVVVKYRT